MYVYFASEILMKLITADTEPIEHNVTTEGLVNYDGQSDYLSSMI